MIPSISYDQHDILRWINELHLDGEWIECDPCYGKGNFYKPDDVPEPRYKYDITAKYENIQLGLVRHSDCRKLPFPDGKLSSIIFDPPFLQTTGEGSIIKDRFGSYPTMEKLWEMYDEAIREFCRVLQPGGILVVKMQNTVMSGKQWWSVDQITSICKWYFFDKIDEFILLAKNRMERTGKYTQKHARKFHSFFLVFKKL